MYGPTFALAGVALVGASLIISSPLISDVLGATDFAVVWSSPERIRKRVEKGWYPRKEKEKKGK
jgi:hypothetical protein